MPTQTPTRKQELDLLDALGRTMALNFAHQINLKAQEVKVDFPYKAQHLLERAIHHLQHMV